VENKIEEQVKNLSTEVKNKIAEVEKNLKEGNEGRVKELRGEIETLANKWQEAASKNEEAQKQLDELSTKFEKLKREGAGAAKAHTMTAQEFLLKEMEKDEEAFKAFRENKRNAPKMAYKAAGTMTFGTNTTGVVVDRTYLPGISGDVRRRNRVRQILGQGTMTGDALQYVVQSGGEGGANNVDEGGTKPATDKDIVLKSAPARKIAHHIRISDELLNDLPAISSFLTFQGSQDVYDKEDQQLLFGSGTGTPTQLEGLTARSGVLDATDVSISGLTAAQKVDAIIAACSALAAQEYMPDTIMLNPQDVYDIMLLKASDNDYLQRINFTTDGRLVIKGIVVFETTAMAAGNFLVGEMSRAAQMFQREGLSVRFFDQDQDNAVKNLITVVIEERIALAVPYEDAIFYDSFADVINAVS